MPGTQARQQPLSRHAGTRRVRSGFFSLTAWVMLALVLVSFLLTYYVPLLRSTKQFGALRHIHGLVFFSWMFLYVWQTQLVARGKVNRHREIGLLGCVLAGALLVLGVWMALHAAGERAASGATRPYEFTWYNLVDLTLFMGFVLGAIATVTRRTDWHRRLMYIAALSLVAPAFSRWTLLLPLPSPWLDMAPNLIIDVFLVALVLHDRKNLGAVHTGTWTGILVTVPLHVVSPWIAMAGWWNHIAPRLLG